MLDSCFSKPVGQVGRQEAGPLWGFSILGLTGEAVRQISAFATSFLVSLKSKLLKRVKYPLAALCQDNDAPIIRGSGEAPGIRSTPEAP